MEHINTFGTTVPAGSILSAITAPFRAIGRFLIGMSEYHPRAQAINRLNALSDTDLAALGLTREAELRRIFGGAFY